MKFEVRAVETDAKTGFTKIVIVYDFGHGPEMDQRGFINPDMAHNYIALMRRDYLKKMFELYVHHAKHIFEKSRLNYYQEKQRLDTLQRCLNAVRIICAEESLKVICSYIVSSDHLLRNILPLSTNPSFESSEERLTVMLQIAKQVLIAEKSKLASNALKTAQ